MNIIHLTNNDYDGAGKAALVLHKALLNRGEQSTMLVYRKKTDEEMVFQVCDGHPVHSVRDILKYNINFLKFAWHKVCWKIKELRWRPTRMFSFDVPFIKAGRIKEYLEKADIICLYSVQSFLTSSLIKEIYQISKAPLVWTFVDMEPLSGGCHFNNGCMKFTEMCGKCPQISSEKETDISRRVMVNKREDYKDLPITFVAGTTVAADVVAQSSLFKNKPIKKILLSVEPDLYKEMDRQEARRELKLPLKKNIISFGCLGLSAKRKGGHLLLEAINKLSKYLEDGQKDLLKNTILVTFGRQEQFDASHLPVQWLHLGELNDLQKMRALFYSTDVLACPSTDDFGPRIINEAYMCGVPVVAFNRSGGLDIIKSEREGYLAEIFDTDDFALGLYQCLVRETKSQKINRDLCSPEHQTKEYMTLFEDVMRESKQSYSLA